MFHYLKHLLGKQQNKQHDEIEKFLSKLKKCVCVHVTKRDRNL